MSQPWSSPGAVETFTGGQFNIFDPKPEDVRLQDIAAGLAHTCRFGGHCRNFYSVAHHSIHVSHELPSNNPRLQFIGLLHDAGEAYIGDIPRPLKAKHGVFARLEDHILDAVWASFDIAPPHQGEWEKVMAADDRLLAYEATHILQDGSWAERAPDLGYDLQSHSFERIRNEFRSRSEKLLNQL